MVVPESLSKTYNKLLSNSWAHVKIYVFITIEWFNVKKLVSTGNLADMTAQNSIGMFLYRMMQSVILGCVYVRGRLLQTEENDVYIRRPRTGHVLLSTETK